MKIEIKKTEKPYTCTDCGAWIVGTKHTDKVGAPLCRYCADKANGQVRRDPSITGTKKNYRKGEKGMEIKEQMEKNRVKADQLLEVCQSCPHNGENCLELDNQCPDQDK
jgi:hypothetical protein